MSQVHLFNNESLNVAIKTITDDNNILCMENLNLLKEIIETINTYKPRDRDMRHPTAKLIKRALADDQLIRKLEDVIGTFVDEVLEVETSFIGPPFPCEDEAHVNLIERRRLVSYNGSIFQFIDVIEWDEDYEIKTRAPCQQIRY